MAIYTKIILVLAFAVAAGCGAASMSSNNAISKVNEPAPETAAPAPTPGAKGMQTAIFAGGCFWGVEAVFEHVKGVKNVVSGYAGGEAKTAEYEKVGEGDTGHAESVKVTFDPAKVTYTQLLTVFFSVAHDPTELNRQGPDTGTQYRSAIFYVDEDQKKTALAYIDAITKSKALNKPIVTEVSALKGFYEAEAYHQDYMAHHPDDSYIVYNDKPKVEALKAKFPDLYVEK